jgi:hypothetical protein
MVTSCRFHPNLHAAMRLSKHKPIANDCSDAMTHVNIVAQYFDGKTLTNLNCLRKLKRKSQITKTSIHESITVFTDMRVYATPIFIKSVIL